MWHLTQPPPHTTYMWWEDCVHEYAMCCKSNHAVVLCTKDVCKQCVGIDKIYFYFYPLFYSSKFYLLFSLTLPIIPNKNQRFFDTLYKT